MTEERSGQTAPRRIGTESLGATEREGRKEGRGQAGCGSGRHEADGWEWIEVSGGYEGSKEALCQSRGKKRGGEKIKTNGKK